MKATVCAVTVVALICGMRLGVAVAAATPEQTCIANKLKAWGKRRSCGATEHAKGVLGKPSDPSKCETKFTDTLTKLDTKASAKSVPCRSADNSDGTVTDYDTGLQWEKKTSGSCSNALLICLTDTDCPAGTCVANDPHYVNDEYTWIAAQKFVGNSSANSSAPTGVLVGFAGYSDWRVPTFFELKEIENLIAAGCGSTGPTGVCSDPIFGPTSGGAYWSSTVANNPFDDSNAWAAILDGLSNMDTLVPAHVRAVRSAL